MLAWVFLTLVFRCVYLNVLNKYNSKSHVFKVHYYFDTKFAYNCSYCAQTAVIYFTWLVYNIYIFLQVVSLWKNGWRQMPCRVFLPRSPELHWFTWQGSVVEPEQLHSNTVSLQTPHTAVDVDQTIQIDCEICKSSGSRHHYWGHFNTEPVGADVDCCVQTDNIAVAKIGRAHVWTPVTR